MRHIAQRLAVKRRLKGLGLAAAAALVMTATLGASSAIAASTVTIKTSFENSPISLNTSNAVGFALTNTTGASQTVAFTDTLPSGVVLDDPVGTASTNGTGTCTLVSTNATPAAGAVTTTVTVPDELASGTVCTISYSVVAGTPSNDVALHDAYSGVSATPSGIVGTTPGSLTVLSNPSLSLSAPSSNQSFYLGQTFNASFACAATDPLDSIDSFFGTDDEGNQIQSGAPIDTVDPGSHTLAVDCYSAAGGGQVSQSVNYTVGSYTLSAVKVAKATDYVSFKTLVPAGKIAAEVIYGKKVIGTKILAVSSRGTASITIKPSTAGKKLLATIRGRTAAVKLQVSFNPQAIGTGDEQITPAGATVVTKSIKLPISHPAKPKKASKAKQRRG